MSNLKEIATDKLVDIFLDRVFDMGTDEIQKLLQAKIRQKTLIKCIDHFAKSPMFKNEYPKEELNYDKEMILKIEDDKLRPELTTEELENNLREVFRLGVHLSQVKESNMALKTICEAYRKRISATIGLADLMNAVHSDKDKIINKLDAESQNISNRVENSKKDLEDKIGKESQNISVNMENSTKKLENKIDEQSQDSKKICELIKKLPKRPLQFIDALDNSREYCYILFKLAVPLTESLAERFYSELEDEIYIELGWTVTVGEVNDDGLLHCVIFNFEDGPVPQWRIKELLHTADTVFSEKGIGILGVYTHE